MILIEGSLTRKITFILMLKNIHGRMDKQPRPWWNQLTGEYEAVSAVAKQYKAKGMGSIVVAEENYGEYVLR